MKRFSIIDCLRVLAAFSIVFYHLVALKGLWIQGTNFLPDWFVVASVYGGLGVPLLFIISGFVITGSIWGKTNPEFIASRISRLLPAYLAAVLLAFVIQVSQTSDFHKFNFNIFAVNSLLLQGALGAENVNGAFWTMWVEITFYSLLLFLARKKLTYSRVLGFAVAWPILAVYFRTLGVEWLAGALQQNFAPLFAGGICIFLIRKYGQKLLTWLALFVNVVLSTNQLLSQNFQNLTSYSGIQLSTMVGATLVFLCFASVYLGSVAVSFPKRVSSVITYVGSITYALYLVHQNLGRLIISKLQGILEPNLVLTISVMSCVLVAVLVNAFIERPFGSILHSKIRTNFESTSFHDRGGAS